MRWRRGSEGPTVHRITAARRSLAEDVGDRQRRYVISMLIRTLAVVLTVLLWQVSVPVASVTLVAGLVLPYVAVVIANAGRENVPRLPPVWVTGAASPPRLPSSEGVADGAPGAGQQPEGRG